MREYDPNEYDELWDAFNASLTPNAEPDLNEVIQTLLYKMENAMDALISDAGSRGYVIWLLKETIRENSHYRVKSEDES